MVMVLLKDITIGAEKGYISPMETVFWYNIVQTRTDRRFSPSKTNIYVRIKTATSGKISTHSNLG